MVQFAWKKSRYPGSQVARDVQVNLSAISWALSNCQAAFSIISCTQSLGLERRRMQGTDALTGMNQNYLCHLKYLKVPYYICADASTQTTNRGNLSVDFFGFLSLPSFWLVDDTRKTDRSFDLFWLIVVYINGEPTTVRGIIAGQLVSRGLVASCQSQVGSSEEWKLNLKPPAIMSSIVFSLFRYKRKYMDA